MKILRVFPVKNNATPDDDKVRIGAPGIFDAELDVDEVRISVTFKWHLAAAEKIAEHWAIYYPGKVKIGGVACGDPGGEFEPGVYLKTGYVITSRGCPNGCWFCDVPKREGKIREIEIKAGNNILDNNLLACSEKHVRGVFKMLDGQAGIQFTGGLEAARLRDWHVEEMRKLKIKQMFFAYDEESDYEPLVAAGKLLLDAGYKRSSHMLRCFVLCGGRSDTVEAAEVRMEKTMRAGFMPMAMFYRPDGFTPITKMWHDFVGFYTQPWLMSKKYKSMGERATA